MFLSVSTSPLFCLSIAESLRTRVFKECHVETHCNGCVQAQFELYFVGFSACCVVRVPWMSDSVGVEGTLVPSQLRYICCACVCVLEPRSKPRKYAPYTCTADVGSSKAFLSLLSKPPGDNRIYRLSCFVKPRML